MSKEKIEKENKLGGKKNSFFFSDKTKESSSLINGKKETVLYCMSQNGEMLRFLKRRLKRKWEREKEKLSLYVSKSSVSARSAFKSTPFSHHYHTHTHTKPVVINS